jgi:hypothetical protein
MTTCLNNNIGYNLLTVALVVVYYKLVEKGTYDCQLFTSAVIVLACLVGYVLTQGQFVQNIFVGLGTWHFLHLINYSCSWTPSQKAQCST